MQRSKNRQFAIWYADFRYKRAPLKDVSKGEAAFNVPSVKLLFVTEQP